MKTVRFENSSGDAIFLKKNATLEELIKAGVSSIRIAAHNKPLLQGEFRHVEHCTICGLKMIDAGRHANAHTKKARAEK